MKAKIFWTVFLGVIGAVVASKDAVIDPTKVGIFSLVGAALGFTLGFVLSKRSKASAPPNREH